MQVGQDRFKRFSMPQFAAPSSQVNQANSEVMQASAQAPSSDIYSGAKQGVAQIQTGLESKESSVASPEMFGKWAGGFPASAQPSGPEATSSLAMRSTIPQQSTQRPPVMPQVQVDPNTPDAQVGRPQTGIQTGLKGAGQSLENEAAGMVRSAHQAPALDQLSAATVRQNQAIDAANTFDPTQQPVSKKRKAAGIASGILTGLTGGGIQGGIKAYDSVTRKPALEKQAQLNKIMTGTGLEQQGALKNAETVDKFGSTNKELAGVMQNVGKDTSANEQYDETGRARIQGQTALDTAQAVKAGADTLKTQKETDILNRPPKPDTTVKRPGEQLIQTGLNPSTNTWENQPIAGNAGDAQNLPEQTEMIARGAALSAGFEPNAVIRGYREGDPAMSKFVKDAMDQWTKDHDASMALGSTSQIQQYYDELNQPHTFEYMPGRGGPGKLAPLDESKIGVEGMTKGKAAPNLGAVEENAYRNAKLAQTTIPDAVQQITALKDHLGALKGRINNFLTDDVGTKFPEFAGLQTTLKNLAVFLAATHTGRFTTPLMKEFEAALGNVHQDPANLIQKLNEMNKSVVRVQDEIEKANPGSAQVRASKASTPVQKAPAVGTVEDGHRFKGGDPSKPENWEKVK